MRFAHPNKRSPLFLAFVLLGMLGILGLSVSAHAQSRAEINKKIETLEKQLQAVQRQVFDGDSPYFSGPDSRPSSATGPAMPSGSGSGAGTSVLMADMSVKIAALETQLRTLTGQIESLQYQNQQLNDRLTRFERDTALRLNTLEGNVPQAGAVESDSRPLASTDRMTDQPLDTSQPTGLIATPTPADAQDLLRASPSSVSPTAGTQPQSPEQVYEAAYDLLRRGQVDESEQAFRAFLADHPDNPLAGNAQYWLGESYYVRQDYPRAAQAFLTGYQDYGDSNKAPDSLLKLGITLAALGQQADACAAFDELDSRYPDAEDRIKQRLSSERTRLDCR